MDHIQMHFVPGVPKFSALGLPQLWGLITLCATLRLQWSLKKSCSLCRDLFNGMLHATSTLRNQVDSQLLMVGSQTTNLIHGLSFGHNLCFRCPNGSCEPILDIYASISFQFCKKPFKPMSFDPCNRPLKIETPIPKMGVHLGVWRFIPSLSFALPWTLDVTLGLPSLVASPRLGLQ